MKGESPPHQFLGVDGMDREIGITPPDILEAQLNVLMIQVARQVTAVADASKLGKRSLSVIGKAASIHRLITDRNADEGMVGWLRSRGVEVLAV